MAMEEIYDKFFDDTEITTEHLGLMPVIAILATYLLIILQIGPSYMKSRPAYQLKTFIIVYNVLQVLACVYLVYRICSIDLPSLQIWRCVDYNPESIQGQEFLYICLFTFWLKVVELSETVVFVLRKKQRQVSLLHVFHHCTMVFLSHEFVKFKTHSAMLFPIFLNSLVHIVMYSYYLTAAVLPANAVAKLTPVKKAITTMQLIQFVILMLQVVILFILGCRMPMKMVALFVFMLTAFFYMFYEFYKNNYSVEKKTKRESNKATAVKN